MSTMPAHPDVVDAIDWSAALVDNQGWLRKVLRSRVSDLHVVEDLFQELSLAVFRQKSKPSDPQKVAPWLYRLAIRYAINFHRRNGRQRRLMEQVQSFATNDTNQNTDALQWMVHDEQRELMRRAMQMMRAQDREILILKYTEHWSYKQLSDHLGAGMNTVEYRLLRAKKRLRKILTSMSVHGALS